MSQVFFRSLCEMRQLCVATVAAGAEIQPALAVAVREEHVREENA